MNSNRWSQKPLDPKAWRKAQSQPDSNPPVAGDLQDITKSAPLFPRQPDNDSAVAVAEPPPGDKPESEANLALATEALLPSEPEGASAASEEKTDPAESGAQPEPRPAAGVWFQSRGSQTALATMCSALVHLAVVLLLGLAVFRPFMDRTAARLNATLDRPQELLTQELEERLTPVVELSSVASSAAMQQGRLDGSIGGLDAQAALNDVAADVGPPAIDVGPLDLTPARGAEWALPVPDGAIGEPIAPVSNYDEAMDRITQEILASLARGKVLVIWCFDQSESMKDDQREIRDRIEKVYAELRLAPAARNDALLTAVTSYGENFVMHTRQPESDLDKVRQAIDAVPSDPSGLEKMCQAVHRSIAMHHNLAIKGHRQLMLILVTDESGDPADNLQSLEAAIQEARRTRCTVYTLGREAVFGYPYAHIAWTDPETQIGFYLPVDRGPETPFPEQLQIDGFMARNDAHPSGFGPYEQSRLARETNGVFFMLPGLEANIVRGDNRRYELQHMRPYLPDLNARDAYAAEVKKSELRTALYKIVSDMNPYNPEHAQHIVLRLTFSIAPEAFANEVQAAQQTAEGMVRYLDAAQKRLEELRPQLEQEASPRWQANYKLMYAQIVSYKVRVYEYGAYLEAFKRSPKLVKNIYGPFKKTNYWGVGTRSETITGDLTKAYIEKSTELLKAIIAEHPGTPWATRAEYELSRGFGVELVEGYSDPRGGAGIKVPKL